MCLLCLTHPTRNVQNDKAGWMDRLATQRDVAQFQGSFFHIYHRRRFQEGLAASCAAFEEWKRVYDFGYLADWAQTLQQILIKHVFRDLPQYHHTSDTCPESSISSSHCAPPTIYRSRELLLKHESTSALNKSYIQGRFCLMPHTYQYESWLI